MSAGPVVSSKPVTLAPLGLSILLLEDSALDAQLVEARLDEAGFAFELVRVDSRAAFIRAISDPRFDIILADYNVPSFEGTEALAAARSLRPETPFVFVTGALGEEKAIELLKQGATDYVLKDRLERLAPSVERALREAHEKTERKRAEQARWESERKLTTLMSNMPGMAFRRVPATPWVFEYASKGAVELSGHQPEDFYADGCTTWSAVMHAEDAERVAREAELAFREQRQLTVTYRIRTRSGVEKWVLERSVGLYDAAGTLEFVEGFVADVTQQKAAEAEAQKRADFEKHLLGIVSHDLRNPLNVIMLASSVALQHEELDERVVKSLLRIRSSGDRAARLIRDLLDFTQARLGGGIHIDPRPVRLDELVQQVVDEAETTHPGRQIRAHHHGNGFGEWDPDRLAQALANLVVNALRYSPPDSLVTVTTHGETETVTLEVHNSGEPLSPQVRAHLFQPMQRGVSGGDSAGRSVGLGLYIVDHIARAHGGAVDVQSSPTEGNTFRIRLPRRKAQGTP